MNIIESYCTNNSRYKAAQIFSPQGIVLHSIGTPQPKARVLYNYWQNNGSPYVVHYMVDDTEILHCMPDNYKCWHVCSPGNDKWIGIEMGEPSQIKYTSGATFTVSDLSAARAYCEKTYKNAVWLIAYLCKKYGWDPMTQVWTHYEITKQKLSNTDHVDPQHLWNGLGLGYNLAKLRQDVKKAMNSSSSTTNLSSNNSQSKLVVGQKIKLKSGAKYTSGKDIPSWVINSTCYVREINDDGSITFSVFETGAITGVISTDYIEGQESSSPSSSSPSSEYLVTVTSASGLNVRSGPGTNYSIVNVLEAGGAYTIIEEQNGWGLLKGYKNNRDGWIYLIYTRKI